MKNFFNFSQKLQIQPTAAPQHVIVEFLVQTSMSSTRPKSTLNLSTAAISNYFRAHDLESPIDKEVNKLVEGLIKCETKEPMIRSRVMPVQSFVQLFKNWGPNESLSIWALRLKTITLMSLTVMMCPSDVAPRSSHFDHTSMGWTPNELRREWITFLPNGYVEIYLFGTKNDYERDGFRVCIPGSDDVDVDPVEALRCYMEITNSLVSAKSAVFIGLQKPYRAICAATVAGILSKAIELAGLAGQGYSAKCFRPTGATKAVEAGLEADKIRAVGRWKCAETFERHYVHAKAPSKFTDSVLKSS